jgi:hypothetical protein
MTQAMKLTAATIDGVSYSGDDPKIGEISRRLNAHDDLVATLQAIAWTVNPENPESEARITCLDEVERIARAALAKLS